VGLKLLRLAEGSAAGRIHDRHRRAGGTATISAPGFTAAKQDDYKLAIEKISQYAIEKTNYDRRLMEGSR
jgi:hypothetical protein